MKTAISGRSQVSVESSDTSALRMNPSQTAHDPVDKSQPESDEEDSEEESQVF